MENNLNKLNNHKNSNLQYLENIAKTQIPSILKIWQLECVYTRDYGPAKPNPWMYQECMRVTGSDSSNTIIFEDSDIGIKGAKASGARVVPIKNSTDLIEKLRKL